MQVEGRWGILFDNESFQAEPDRYVDLFDGDAIINDAGAQRRGRYKFDGSRLVIDLGEDTALEDLIVGTMPSDDDRTISATWRQGSVAGPMDEPIAMYRVTGSGV